MVNIGTSSNIDLSRCPYDRFSIIVANDIQSNSIQKLYFTKIFEGLYLNLLPSVEWSILRIDIIIKAAKLNLLFIKSIKYLIQEVFKFIPISRRIFCQSILN